MAARLVSVVVLVAAVIPVGRLAVDTRFGAVFPRARLALAAFVTLWVAAVVAAGVLLGMWVVLPAAVVGLGSATAWWRARPNRGATKRWPPGSLSLTRSVRSLAHREAKLALADRYGPIFKETQGSATVVCIVGLARGQQLVREHRSAVGPSPLAFDDQVTGGFLRYMDDATHDLYGAAIRRAMSRGVTDAATPIARRSTASVLAQIGPVPEPPDRGVERIAYETTLAALFGIDPATDEGVAFTAVYQRFAQAGIHRIARTRVDPSLDELRRLVADRLDRLGAADTGPVPVCALSELRAAGAGLPDAVCVDNLLFMLKIGSSNVAGLLRWLLEVLARDPAWVDRLRAASSPASAAGVAHEPDLVDAFVMEVLRVAQSEYVYRRLHEDVEFEGYRLRAGWLVRICVWESHRDPAVYDDPAAVTDRFVGARRPLSEYCPFGFDRHACNAVGLSMMIARTLVEAVCRDPALDLRPAGAVVRELRFAAHWRPGPDLAWRRSGAAPMGEIPVEQELQPPHVIGEDLDQPRPQRRIEHGSVEVAEEPAADRPPQPFGQVGPQRSPDAGRPGPHRPDGPLPDHAGPVRAAREIGGERGVDVEESEHVGHRARRVVDEVVVEEDPHAFATEQGQVRRQEVVVPTAPQQVAEGHLVRQGGGELAVDAFGETRAGLDAVALPAHEVGVRPLHRIAQDGHDPALRLCVVDPGGDVERLQVDR
jgi:cytochrome P450